jgi:hypothetical protein
MEASYTHPSLALPVSQPALAAALAAPSGTVAHIAYAHALAAADRACCCTARPAVAVIMAAAPGRAHRTDLLLCMHHYRAARQALTGATVVDAAGHVLAAADIWGDH